MPYEMPLISAIMPTRGRRQWAAEAVEMFREQTYSARELVIVDDALEPSFDSAPEGTVYVRAGRISLGAKRNLAASRAGGEIICHWDSDDLYAADRIEHQAAVLFAHPEAQIVGYHQMEFVDGEQRYLYDGPEGYCIGVSMMYWRETWRKAPFRLMDNQEDNAFLAGKRAVSVPASGRIVARIHNGNTDRNRRRNLNCPPWRLLSASVR